MTNLYFGGIKMTVNENTVLDFLKKGAVIDGSGYNRRRTNAA
jgi:hypothetical protein